MGSASLLNKDPFFVFTDVQKTSYSLVLSVTSGSSENYFPISSGMSVQSFPSSLDVEPLPAALRSQQLTCMNPPALSSAELFRLTPALKAYRRQWLVIESHI